MLRRPLRLHVCLRFHLHLHPTLSLVSLSGQLISAAQRSVYCRRGVSRKESCRPCSETGPGETTGRRPGAPTGRDARHRPIADLCRLPAARPRCTAARPRCAAAHPRAGQEITIGVRLLGTDGAVAAQAAARLRSARSPQPAAVEAAARLQSARSSLQPTTRAAARLRSASSPPRGHQAPAHPQSTASPR